ERRHHEERYEQDTGASGHGDPPSSDHDVFREGISTRGNSWAASLSRRRHSHATTLPSPAARVRLKHSRKEESMAWTDGWLVASRWAVTASAIAMLSVGPAVAGDGSTPAQTADTVATATPIKHLIVVIGENRSFDHVFGTY